MGKRSLVWKFFTAKPGSRTVVTCNKCGSELKIVGFSTTGMRSHLTALHPELRIKLEHMENIVAVAKADSSSSVEAEPQVVLGGSSSGSQPVAGPSGLQRTRKRLYNASEDIFDSDDEFVETQTPSRSSKKPRSSQAGPSAPTKPYKSKTHVEWPPEHPDNVNLVNHITKWVVVTNQPFRVVDHPVFIDMMKAATYGRYCPINRKSLSSTRIPRLYNFVKGKIDEIIATDKVALDGVAFTTDIWTSKNNSPFQSLTLHYIDRKFVLKRFLVKMESFPGSHTAELIGQKLTELVLKLDLPADVSSWCTSDGGSNVRKALLESPVIDTAIRCVDHVIHRVVTQALKSVPSMVKLKEKVSKLVLHFNHSAKATGQLRKVATELGLSRTKLVQSVATRWNSDLHQFESILDLFPALSEITQTGDSKVEQLLPSVQEKLDLQAVSILLQPWATLSELASSDKGPTLHLVIPHFANIQRKLTVTANSPPSELVGGVAQALKDELEIRFPKSGSKEKEFILAHFLDPSVKGALLRPNFLGGFAEGKQMVLDELMVFVRSEAPSRSPTPEEQQVLGDDDDIFNECIRDTYGSNPTQSNKRAALNNEVESELEVYLKDPVVPRGTDLLDFWKMHRKRFPHLSLLARKILCIPAASATSERVFSGAGQICTERRTCLDIDKIETLVFLKENFLALERLNVQCLGF